MQDTYAELPAVSSESEPEALTDALMDPTQQESAEAEAQAPKKPVAGYRVLAIAVLLLAAGGLFLGLLGKYVGWLGHSYYVVAEGAKILPGSFLGYIIYTLQSFFTNLSGYFNGSLHVIEKELAVVAVSALVGIAVVIALICAVIALCSRKAAKNASMTSLLLSVLAYGAAFGWSYCYNCLHAEKLGLALVDVPVALICGALVLILIVTAICRKHWTGVFNSLLFLCTGAALFAVFYPASYTVTGINGVLQSFKSDLFLNISLLAAVALIGLNLVIGIFRLCSKRGFCFDCIRYALMLLAVVLVVVASMLKTPAYAMFEKGTLLASLTLVVASIGALILALVLYLTARLRKRIAEEKDLEASAEAADSDKDFPSEFLGEAGTASETTAEPISQEAVAAEVPHTASGKGVSHKADRSGTHYSQETAVAAAVVSEPGSESEPTDFERTMLAVASGESEPVVPAPQEPMAEPIPAPAPAPAPGYSDPGTIYTYDPFIKSLTPTEKDEFGDLFIACIRGTYGDLPVYTIGGDNTEFFNKVWLRYGAYDMSSALKKKLFDYILHLKKKD